MMDGILIGRFVPGNSVLHRMDPRSKLLLVFFFVCIVFLANNVVTYTILGLFTIIMIAMSQIPFRFILKGLRPILFLILFTFILHILFTKEGDVWLDLGWLKIYEGGIKQGVFISLRFAYLILITTLLTLSTTPISLTDGLEELLNPFKKIKLPVHELALMMSISLRFIPTLLEETNKIMKAQTARGVDFSSGPIKDRISAVVPLLVPLFVNSFKRAEELATAMEARGYRGGEGRTKYRQLHWGVPDTALMFSLVVLTAVLIYFRA